jgi:hypothetical protein
MASGVQTLAFSSTTLFASMATATNEYNFTSPFHVSPVRSGVVSIYASSSWSSAQLKVGQQPTAVSWNPSGNVSVVTLQNEFYTINVTGGIVASGVVAQFAGQAQSTPIGMSYLWWLGANLYSATSMNDSLVQLV